MGIGKHFATLSECEGSAILCFAQNDEWGVNDAPDRSPDPERSEGEGSQPPDLPLFACKGLSIPAHPRFFEQPCEAFTSEEE